MTTMASSSNERQDGRNCNASLDDSGVFVAAQAQPVGSRKALQPLAQVM